MSGGEVEGDRRYRDTWLRPVRVAPLRLHLKRADVAQGAVRLRSGLALVGDWWLTFRIDAPCLGVADDLVPPSFLRLLSPAAYPARFPRTDVVEIGVIVVHIIWVKVGRV
ncbi:MAG TPA: hypothetical protein VFG22_02655, partial [Polyangiales bacterium]|nr:hypothetical protein [Polyangiales bacterium]